MNRDPDNEQQKQWEKNPEIRQVLRDLRARAAANRAKYHFTKTEIVRKAEQDLKDLGVPPGLIARMLVKALKGAGISASTVYASVSDDCKDEDKQTNGHKADKSNKKRSVETAAARTAAGGDNPCKITGGVCALDGRACKSPEDLRKLREQIDAELKMVEDGLNETSDTNVPAERPEIEYIPEPLLPANAISSVIRVAGAKVENTTTTERSGQSQTAVIPGKVTSISAPNESAITSGAPVIASLCAMTHSSSSAPKAFRPFFDLLATPNSYPEIREKKNEQTIPQTNQSGNTLCSGTFYAGQVSG